LGSLKKAIVEAVDREFGVFDGLSFRVKKFEGYLQKEGIAWPRLESGRLALDEETFKTQASLHPKILTLMETRNTLSKMRLISLTVGCDGRNRSSLAPFRAKTGRNQPSNSKFIFGSAAWMRHLIRPSPGFALAVLDYEQQEFGIAGALSSDENMMEAYLTGDPYLAFAKQARAIPENATKATHKVERDRYKTCALAVQYGMGARSLAAKLGMPLPFGNKLIEKHKKLYPKFWAWIANTSSYARIKKRTASVFGWQMAVSRTTPYTSLSNFPMQANGAEMLRLAIIIAATFKVKVIAPIHDALMIEAPVEEINEAVRLTQQAMREASKSVLRGFEIRTDLKVIQYPDRYVDERGTAIWNLVSRFYESATSTDERHCTGEVSNMHSPSNIILY